LINTLTTRPSQHARVLQRKNLRFFAKSFSLGISDRRGERLLLSLTLTNIFTGLPFSKKL